MPYPVPPLQPTAQATCGDAALVAALLTAVLGIGSAAYGSDATTPVRGEVVIDIPGVSLASLGPVVVYLEPGPNQAHSKASETPAKIVQRGARFRPSFLVVEAGRRVEMPNADRIYHNAFSYSKPNDFDLGFYPTGESRGIVLKHPGVVKTYCSIHESMNATILVTPSTHHAVVGATGRFSLDGVPEGSWILRSWSERLPGTAQAIELIAGRPAEFEIRLAATPPPAVAR